LRNSSLSPFLPATLLFAVLVTLLITAPLPVSGQSRPDTTVISDPTPPVAVQPFLDRKVGSSWEKFSRWMGRMKSEHFSAYLTTFIALVAGGTGLFFAAAAYRLSDPMSPYRLIKRRTLQLAMAIGGSLGILVAVMQVPPNAPGRVSLLLLAIGVGAASSLTGSWIAFQAMRFLSNRSARRDGRRLTERMRQA
jgi:hypothetical protein